MNGWMDGWSVEDEKLWKEMLHNKTTNAGMVFLPPGIKKNLKNGKRKKTREKIKQTWIFNFFTLKNH